MAQKRLHQEVIPAVFILSIDKDTNTCDVRYMLEGQNLIHDEGKEFALFLKQAVEAKVQENEEEEKEGDPHAFSGDDYHFAQQLQEELY